MPSDLPSRLETLEELVLHDRSKIGKRSGVPFIVFTYPPQDGLEVDGEIEGFIDKLRFNKQSVGVIDMRDLFFRTVEELGIAEGAFDLEQTDPQELSDGFKEALLEPGSSLGPIPNRIIEAAEASDTVVVYRMGILFPFSSVSMLMGLLEGKVPSDIPIVFFYPATRDNKTLRFLDRSEGTYYRAKII